LGDREKDRQPAVEERERLMKLFYRPFISPYHQLTLRLGFYISEYLTILYMYFIHVDACT